MHPLVVLVVVVIALAIGACGSTQQTDGERMRSLERKYGTKRAIEMVVAERGARERSSALVDAERQLLALDDSMEALVESRRICQTYDGRLHAASPERDRYIATATKVRARQLDALHDSLIAREPQLASMAIFHPTYDQGHRTYVAFREAAHARTSAIARHQQRVQAEQTNALIGGLGLLLAAGLVIHASQIDEVRADGKCPTCRGNKVVSKVVREDCALCSHGFTHAGRCQRCSGRGYTSEYVVKEDCKDC